MLLDTAEDLRAQSSCVERAFSQRCQEISLAHSQLEIQLGEVGGGDEERKEGR